MDKHEHNPHESHNHHHEKNSSHNHHTHDDNMDHSSHSHSGGGHSGHHGHMVEDFKKRFWVSFILTIPISFLSEMFQMLFNYEVTFTGNQMLLFVLSTVLLVYGGKPFIVGAWNEIKEKAPGMMLLIFLAIVASYLYSSLTIFFIEGMDFFFELASLIAIMLLGHWIEMKSVMGASKALEELIKLMPKEANKIDEDGNTKKVSVEELTPGDNILVKSGEKVPLDGKIVEGRSSIDESMLTGESVPVEKGIDEEVIGGSINGEGVLQVTVSKTGKDTYLSQVIQLVQDAESSKSRAQGLADIASKWLFYAALIIGVATFVFWTSIGNVDFALERMVTVFIIACPHALGLAIPLVTSRSTSLAAQKGLLIRNRIPFETAYRADRIVFDKTGTLTEGNFGVMDILPAEGITEEELIHLAYTVETQSNHPIAKGIQKEGEKRQLKPKEVKNYQNLTGKGLEAEVEGSSISVLSPGGMKEKELSYDEETYSRLAQEGKTVIFVVKDDELQGVIALADIIRESSYQVIKQLNEKGIETVMISGDNERVANYVGKELGLSQVIAEVLPDEKSEKIKELKEDGSKVMMVGDGINDAPALAEADLGIAIGAGTDVALETADVVLVNSNPLDILMITELSQASYKKMIQNLIWAAAYNVIALPLAAGLLYNQGILIPPALGAVAMSLSTIICAINAYLLKVD